MFVLSGVAGLVFEVALQRSLTRIFGVSAFATSTVLAAWMAGLALGAVLFGRYADRSRSPLKVYVWLEVGIALAACALPLVVPQAMALFADVARGLEPDDPRLAAGRFVLAFGLTLIPSLLMGGTLPAVTRALDGVTDISRLYTANLVGAAIGAGATSYLLLPSLGLMGTQLFGGALNLVAAVLALVLARQLAPPRPVEPPGPEERASVKLLGLAAWSGFVTFCAEVTWFQLLSTVIGNSAFAFGVMLAIFLFGLTVGSAWLARRTNAGLPNVGWLLLAASVCLAITLPLWDRVPSLFIISGKIATGFASREAVRALAALELLLLPAAALGTLYPLVLHAGWKERPNAARVGGLSAANTLGAVVGSLLTGFVLLPRFGSRTVLVGLVVAGALIAALMLRGRARLWPALVVAFTLLLPPWNMLTLASGANVYFAERFAPEQATLVWQHESVEAGLTTVVEEAGTLTLFTNGKFQGNDSGEVDAQRGFAQIPMLVQHGWGSALVVGLGTGCSLGTIARQPFRDVELVELSGDIIDAARRYFSHINDGALSSPRVRIIHADARNHLLLSNRQYDLISMEISSIWFAGAADLYNREFYQQARARLTPGGVLQQWVQLHHLTRRDFAVVLASLRSEFPHVALFYRGGQGIVLASQAPLWIDYTGLVALRGTPATEHVPAEDPLMLLGSLALNTEGIDALIDEERGTTPLDRFVSTDNSLYLEYSTPRGNAREDLSVDALLSSLAHLPSSPLELRNATEEGRHHAAAARHLALGDFDLGLSRAEKAGGAAAHLIEWAKRQPPRQPDHP